MHQQQSQAERTSEVPGDLHLLAIEGRGISAYSVLLVLREILKRYKDSLKLLDPPRPCDVFDIAGGAGTGGIITIMLFRLKMNVDDAIRAFIGLSKQVSSKRAMNIASLESAIAEVVCSSLDVDKNNAHSVRMLDDMGPKCFVSASASKNLGSPTLFRTYTPPRHASYNCTIVEAIGATTAELEAPFDIGGATFINMLNNPLKSIRQESASIFPGHPISCVLSFGIGAQGIIGLDTTLTPWFKVMNDGERISDEVAKELDPDVFYCRLSVDHGLKDTGFEDCHRLGDVETHTQKYLEKRDVDKKVSELVEVLKRRTIIASTVEDNLMVLAQFLDSLALVLPGDAWSEVMPKLIRSLKSNTAAMETLRTQCGLLKDTIESCMPGKDFVELPDELKGNIRRLLEELKKTFEDAPEQPDPLGYANTNLPKLFQRFWFQNYIAGNIVVHDILKYIQKDDSTKKTLSWLEQHARNQNLDKLNVAPYAGFDSSEVSEYASCFKGTRVRLLNEIASWIADDDPSIAPIYVLDGVAGIGKSTIAKTIAERAAEINALGASFFFSKDDDNRKTASKFFPTIAYQLAQFDSDFADEIDKAVRRNRNVDALKVVKQFLILMEPLKKSLSMAERSTLVVIDALDECEGGGDTLLKIFAEKIKDMPRLKLFITTRPEFHIREVVDRYYHLKRFHLQDIEKSVVESDIRLYLEFHLSENAVQDKLRHLNKTWRPSKKEMELLIGICGTFFILASTGVKFILDSFHSDPANQLSRLLMGVSPQYFSGLEYIESFYTQILSAAILHGGADGLWSERYQIVVGTIVALQYPLRCGALSVLLNLDSSAIKGALCHLHSLVAPTTGDDPIFRIHHKSFPDLVTNQSRCKPPFLIDLKMRHLELGKRCLKILDSQLKPNICNLSSTDRFRDNSDVRDLTRTGISEELIYASTHWATHLASASKLDAEAEGLLDNFAQKHFLSWLEVLSIFGKLESAYPSLDKIAKLLDGLKTKAGITREIVHDGCRFIALNIELIKVAAGHVFSAFIPRDTQLFRTYSGNKGINFEVVSGYEKWNPTISIMKGHEKAVTTATFSADGTKVASASKDGTVRLWDGQTGAEIAVLRGHSNTVNAVAFSPDGTVLASASNDETVRLWDGQTGTEIAVLRGHSREVNSVVYSPDGTRLASGSFGGTALWDGQTGAQIAVLRGHSREVNSVVYSPDGTRLASGSFGGTALWDGQTGAQIAVIEKSAYLVLFSPDGARLASASTDDTVRVWDGQTGDEIAVLRGHSRRVNSVVFSPDGTRLASASDDGTVRLWDGQTCTEIAVIRGHSNQVYSVVFSPNSTRLASASSDGTARLWDGHTGAKIAVLPCHSLWVNSTAFSPDGTILASASSDRTVRLWDGQSGAVIAVLRGHSKEVISVMFSSDGARLASASDDGTVQLWVVRTGVEIAGRSYPVTSVAFSPNGTRLASASDDGTVRLWDSQKGGEIAVLGRHSSWVNSVLFSPDGARLASASSDRTLQLWDGQTGVEIAVLRGHMHLVKSVVFSPDGTRLASASNIGTMRLWDGQTGAQIAVLQGHSDLVNSMLFSLDGTRLASASNDETVRVWDGQTGAEIAALRGHSKRVNSTAFSLDGTRLASASDDRTVRLWDGRTGAAIDVIQHSDQVNSLAFSPDGTRFASACSDGTLQIWDSHTGSRIATSPKSAFFSFTSDGSTLVSMNSGAFYQLSLLTADEVTMPVGVSIDRIKRGVQVPGLNLWVVYVERNQPSLSGFLVFKVDNSGRSLRVISSCWFPTDLGVRAFCVSSLSQVAVGCDDGRVLLLDFSSVL